MKRAALVTLGCKVNWYDSQAMAGALRAAGFEVVESGEAAEPADVYIVNTCAVTQEAERKSRQAVRKLLRLHEGASVIVTGCSSQKDPAAYTEIPGVAGVCGTADRSAVAALAASAFTGEQNSGGVLPPDSSYEDISASSQSGHTRATLKIEDGCDARCAYCILPDVRGVPRSRPLESIAREAEVLSQRGFKEIVLVGINLSRYGMGLPGNLMLADAAQAATVPGIERLRLGSLEPDAITEALMERLSQLPQLCPHFHISLQSGSAGTLARMRRRYNPAQYMDKLKMVRSVWAEAGITTDVIVGFPGETDEEFAESAAFVAQAGFLKAHVFPFSPRPGTPAADMPGQLPNAVKAARAAAMQAAAAPSAMAFLEGMVGKTESVLFESQVEGKPGWMRGYTKNYVDVQAPVGDDARGRILDINLTNVEHDMMSGVLTSPSS